MTLTQIKETLGIKALDLSRGTDENGKATEWLRYWNDKHRFSVAVHQQVVDIIKEQPHNNKLALKHEVKVTKTGDLAGTQYDSYILINAASIEESI